MSGQSPTNWQATDNMKLVLKHMQDNGYDSSIVDACGVCKINRKSYYDWFDNPNFVKWWQEQADRHFELQLPAIQAALARQAKDPKKARVDTTAAKLLLERFDKGYAPRSRQDTKLDATLSVEEIIRRADAGDKEQQDAP